MSNDDLDPRGVAIGDPTIDRQHEEIFRRANRLRTALQEGRAAEEVAELLAFLDDYTSLHFTSEEALMARAGFHGLEAHRQHHAALLQAIRHLEREFRSAGPSPSMAAHLNEAIWSQFMVHVARVDGLFAEFLQARAQRAAG